MLASAPSVRANVIIDRRNGRKSLSPFSMPTSRAWRTIAFDPSDCLLCTRGERVAVEHSLAHLVRRQGRRARYWGVRKNTFDLRRAASVQNLETIDRKLAQVAVREAA